MYILASMSAIFHGWFHWNSIIQQIETTHPVFISGDYEGKVIDCSRAKALLGWEPLERPCGVGSAGGQA